MKDAAVLKGTNFIYGVVDNAKAKELSEKVAPLKREDYDMVPVVIEGKILKNPNKGWEKIVDIQKIFGVSKPTGPLTSTLLNRVSNKETITSQRLI